MSRPVDERWPELALRPRPSPARGPHADFASPIPKAARVR